MYKKRTTEELKKLASFCRMRQVTGEIQPMGPAEFGLIADAVEELIHIRGAEPTVLVDDVQPVVVHGPWPFPKKEEADDSNQHD